MKSPLPFLGWVRAASLYLCLTQTALAVVLTNSTRLESILDKFRDQDEEWWRARPRGKRAISEGDMHLILDLHNKLRGQVHPPASNMEYMVSAANTTGLSLQHTLGKKKNQPLAFGVMMVTRHGRLVKPWNAKHTPAVGAWGSGKSDTPHLKF